MDGAHRGTVLPVVPIGPAAASGSLATLASQQSSPIAALCAACAHHFRSGSTFEAHWGGPYNGTNVMGLTAERMRAEGGTLNGLGIWSRPFNQKGDKTDAEAA